MDADSWDSRFETLMYMYMPLFPSLVVLCCSKGRLPIRPAAGCGLRRPVPKRAGRVRARGQLQGGGLVQAAVAHGLAVRVPEVSRAGMTVDRSFVEQQQQQNAVPSLNAFVVVICCRCCYCAVAVVIVVGVVVQR